MSLVLTFCGSATLDKFLASIAVSPSPSVMFSSMQMHTTGTYSDTSTQIDESGVVWTLNTTARLTVTSPGGLVSSTDAGKIYGGNGPIGITGSLAGVNGTGSMLLVANDSSSIKMPVELNAEWTYLGLSPFGSFWGLQEGAGFSVSSGSLSISLTLNVIQRRTPTENWVRMGAGQSGGNAVKASYTNVPLTAGGQLDPTGSIAILGYHQIKALGGNNRNVCGVASTNAANTVVAGTLTPAGGAPTLYCAGESATGSVNHIDSLVHPWLLVYDKTNSRAELYTDLERVSGPFNALTLVGSSTSSLGFGGILSPMGQASFSGTTVYFAVCTGSVAEALGDAANASAFLTKLGWNVLW